MRWDIVRGTFIGSFGVGFIAPIMGIPLTTSLPIALAQITMAIAVLWLASKRRVQA